jgi:hypothetical protein
MERVDELPRTMLLGDNRDILFIVRLMQLKGHTHQLKDEAPGAVRLFNCVAHD